MAIVLTDWPSPFVLLGKSCNWVPSIQLMKNERNYPTTCLFCWISFRDSLKFLEQIHKIAERRILVSHWFIFIAEMFLYFFVCSFVRFYSHSFPTKFRCCFVLFFFFRFQELQMVKMSKCFLLLPLCSIKC